MGDTILVLCQDDSLGTELVDILNGWGHHPQLAPNSHRAFQVLTGGVPPLIIIDNDFKGQDGLYLVRRINNDHPWTEVIYVVGAEDMDRGATSLEYGASDFLLKPISPRRLATALKRAQERLAMRRKLAALLPENGQVPGLPAKDAALLQGSPASVSPQLYDTLVRYRQLFDEVPCYISVLDQNFQITDLNRRYKEELGDHIGRNCFDVYMGRCEGCPECPVAETFADGQSHQYEQIVTALTGEQYNVVTWTAPLRDATGKITQVLEMSTNISQIRKLQDHLASLGMVISSISHTVKGLLTALDGGIYSIRSGLEKGDQRRIMQGWEVVQLMVGRIRRSVLDVLYYAKERELDVEEVDVADFARQIAYTGEQAAKKYPVEFESHIDPDLGVFHVDPNALNPALINLLENAVDACLEDRYQDKHKIVFSVSREDDVIVFNVEDDGMGMDETTKENIFTLFFTSKGSSGTGLGLFIAHDTVSQHGGDIVVDSDPGVGSHFHVRIPDRPRAVLGK